METIIPLVEEVSAATSSSSFSGLDPILGSLGTLIGLLKHDGNDSYELIPEWFTDPFSLTKKGIVNNPEEFSTLFEELLGKIGGNALGIPVQDPAILGNWYPIKYEKDGKDVNTGVHAVTYQTGENNKTTVLGVGIYHGKDFGTPATLQAAIWGLLPFVAIDPTDTNDPVKITFVEEGYPIVFGAAVNGPDESKPLIDINGIEFNGVKVNANIDLAAAIHGKSPFELGVEIIGLQLAGEDKPSNRSLSDLEAITAEQIMNTASSLFVGGLSKVFPDSKDKISYFPPLFGLSSIVPNTDQKLPTLKWYELFEAAKDNNAEKIFLDWFTTIASDNQRLKTWLSCFSGFLLGKAEISGNGTRSTPFQVALLNVSDIGTLNISMGTSVVEESTRILYPGIAFSGTPLVFEGSDIQFAMSAEAELARFQLTGSNIGLSPTINFKAQFSLENTDNTKPLASFEVEEKTYSIGSLQGGMALGLEANMMPWFGLNAVDIGSTHYDTVDLLSPGQLANAGAAALSEGLQSLLDFGTDNKKLSDSIGAIIGLKAPSGAASSWPQGLVPPFSPAGMVSSIKDPIGSWANYYASVLTYQNEVDGKQAFTYIVSSFAQLLQAATDDIPISITGQGTAKAPWKAGISVKDLQLPAYLTGYQESTDEEVVLTLGMELAPELEIAGTNIVASLELDAATIRFNKKEGFGHTTADWFSQVAAKVTLPKGFQTPAVGGMQAKVDASQLSASWSQANGWSWSMFVNGPALIVDGQTTALGTDLNFNEQSTLEDLVKQSSETFGPFLISALGTMLMRTQTTAGLFVAGTLGLVKDISTSPVFPQSGLSWNGFDLYPFTGFENPWKDLNKQIDQLFGTDDKGKSVLSLLAYTISGANEAPVIKGKGTFAEPWITPGLPLNFNLPIWYNRDKKNLGLGIGRSQTFNYTGTSTTINFDLDIRLNVLEYSTEGQKIDFIDELPSLEFVGTLSNPAGKLVDLGAVGSIDSILLGFNLVLDNGQVVFKPVVTLVNAKLGTDYTSDLVTLETFLSQDFASNLKTAFTALLNGAIQEATKLDSVTGDENFQTLYKLLQLMGLALSRPNVDSPYGINSGGWNALLAEPSSYISGQLESLLLDETQRKELLTFLEQVTGITFPTLPKPALQFLSAIGICGTEAQGFPLLPNAILEVFTNPVQGLTKRFENFFTDSNAVKALAAQIAANIPPTKYGRFTFSTTSNGEISFSILPEEAIELGGLINIFGDVNLNITNETLTFTGDIYIPQVGLTLATALQLRMSQGQLQPPTFNVQLIWGDGLKPAATPLDIYPFNSTQFVDQVAELAPAYTLNILLNAIFEDELLGKYEFIQKIFTGLGIGKNENGIWVMPSLMGILKDPLAWLLSNEVLGTDGRFSIEKLVKLLGELPAKSYNGMQITPMPGIGMELSGLPFGFKVDMKGENNLATFGFGVESIEIVENLAALKNLNFGVSLNQDYQPTFSGGLDIEATIASLKDGFFVHVEYDKDFQLSLSQGTPDKPTGLGVQFLPFQGWGSLAGQALALGATIILDDVVPKLLNELLKKYPDTTKAGKFLAAMQQFADHTDVKTLVQALQNTFTTGITDGLSSQELLSKLETTAFAWVKDRYSQTNAPETALAIVDLLKLALPESSLTTIKGQIQYIPSEKLPFKLLAGLDENNAIGLWAGVELPDMKLLKMAVAPTGVAYNLDTSSLDISFGLDVVVPIENLNGPGLSISYKDNKFDFSFDPLADPNKLGTHSPLNVELLPKFFSGEDIGDKVTAWLLNVIKDVLPRYVSLLVLNQEQVKAWLEAPLISSSQITPVLLLEATELVKETDKSGGTDQDKTYFLNSFDELAKITPIEFLGNFLFTLLKNPLTLLSFGESGKIIIGPKKDVNGYYGLLVQAPNLKIKAIPNLVFQLGGDNTDWITNSTSGTPTFGDKGIGFYVPIEKKEESYTVDFTHFNLVLNNVGFDIVGKNGQPIVDLSRFKLGSVDPRALFEMQFKGSDPIELKFGAGLTMDEMGLSLSPKTISEGGGDNPIAKNVLGSGEEGENHQNTDPRFSVDIGYVDKFWVNLRSNTGNGHEVIIPVQRSFGPLYIENVGLGWEGEKDPPLLDFISSGSFEIAGLQAALQGLRVGMPVTHPTDWSKYTIDLDGFAINYTGGVTIDAGFLKDNVDNVVNYTGVAILSSKKFSLGALGSYAQIKIDNQDSTSMFIFGVLNAPLGGVPAFFITGIAAGFAYNRSLEIPSIENVSNFPLVKGVADGTFTEGQDPMAALVELNSVITPKIGQYWFAAGLKFRSFELLETTALLFLSFGKDFEFNLLGVSVATMPPMAGTKLALAYMELALKVTISPAAGYVSAEAQLTPNSFVLAKGVKLSGGFAFYLWFKDITLKDGTTIHAGDFVVTLGGYHPAFNKPSYYPDVPLLGINWKLDFSVGKVSISGGAYFALCPTAIMAGGYLKIAFDAGPLIAGLDAYANFLIQWRPFYFNVGIGVSVYAGFQTTIAGVSVRLVAKLGCTLELQGPPVFGKVVVDWYVIGFTIPIGDQDNNPSKEVLDWAAFEEAFLPSPTGDTEQPQQKSLATSSTVMLSAAAPEQNQQVVKWTVQQGLEQDDNNGKDDATATEWVLNPFPWKLTVESAIPTSEISVKVSAENSETLFTGNTDIGVRPMGKEDTLKAPLKVTLTDASGAVVDMKARNISLTASKNGVPSALWSRKALNTTQAPDPTKMLLPNSLFGLVINADQYVYNSVVPEFALANLEYVENNPKNLPFSDTPKYHAAALYPEDVQEKAFSMIRQTIMSDQVIITRNSIYSALQASAINAPLNPDLSIMASSVSLILQDFPVMARIGIYQNDGIPQAGVTVNLNPTVHSELSATSPVYAPFLTAQLQSYKLSSGSTNTNKGLPNVEEKAKGMWNILSGIKVEDQQLTVNRSTESKKVYDGTTLVWETCPQLLHDVNIEGSLPILISSFDEYGSLLAFDYQEMSGKYSLPADTGQVMIQGYESDLFDVVGWQLDTKLSKVNNTWAQGDGCLVRVQNGRQITPRKGTIGHIKATCLLDQNKVKSKGDSIRKGWVQTIFSQQCKVVGLLVKGKVSQEAVKVTVAADKVPSKAGNTIPFSTLSYGENTLFLFQVPEETNQYSGTIVTLADQQVQIIGMYGLADSWLNVKASGNTLKLVQAGIDFKSAKQKTAQINLIQKTTTNER